MMNSEFTRLTVLHTGMVIIDEALPYHRESDHPMAWTHLGRSRQHLIEAPVSCYLLEGPRGRVLIDSGWNARNRTKRGQILNLRQQYPVNKAILPEGEAIHEQLEGLGIAPKDLDLVLMSHLHCDHADGLSHIADAKSIVVSAPEWKAANSDRIRYLPHEWAGVPMTTFGWNATVGPFGAGYDVFGDSSMVMVSTPGHAWGLCATLIRSSRKTMSNPSEWVRSVDVDGTADPREFILLVSDVGYGRPSFTEGLRPGVVVNAAFAEVSLSWVREVANDPRCRAIIANHDPEVEAGVIDIALDE